MAGMGTGCSIILLHFLVSDYMPKTSVIFPFEEATAVISDLKETGNVWGPLEAMHEKKKRRKHEVNR